MIDRRQLAARVLTQALRGACRVVGAVCLVLPASCVFPGTVRPTVRIGLVAPFEGRYRAMGYDVIYAARLALVEVNQAGGVGGYAVELVAYDDGAQPAMAVEQARKLDVDPGVLVAVGHFREETTQAAAGAYAQGGLPLVAPAVLDPRLTQEREALYRLGPSADVLAGALLERATELLKACPERGEDDRGVLLVGQGGPLGASLENLAPEWEAENPGWRFASVSAHAAAWRSDALAFDPCVILLDLDPVRAGEVIAVLQRGGWSGHVLGSPALAAADFVAVAGQAAEGATFVTPWPFPPDVPGGDAFAVAYRDVSNGVEPGPWALPAYEATWMVLQALERVAAVGGPTRQGVSAALSAVEREGLLGRLAFNEDQGWPGESLYWYRIGPEGVPRLVETAQRASVASLAGPARLRESG